MRVSPVAPIVIVLVAACAPAPVTLLRPDSDRFASLKMVSSRTPDARAHDYGISSVDGHTVTRSIDSTLYVLEGRRKVGYLCPGWVSTDAGPSITHEFLRNTDYVLDCAGTPGIRVAETPRSP